MTQTIEEIVQKIITIAAKGCTQRDNEIVLKCGEILDIIAAEKTTDNTIDHAIELLFDAKYVISEIYTDTDNEDIGNIMCSIDENVATLDAMGTKGGVNYEM